MKEGKKILIEKANNDMVSNPSTEDGEQYQKTGDQD
jgi:hypothetical protein